MKKVFLSSTAKDLGSYREAVYEAIHGLDGFHCVRMEDFGSRSERSDDFCRQKVEECDLFIGLVGLCYGSTPLDSEDSYTVQEYKAAVGAGTVILMFMSEDNFFYQGVYRETDDLWKKQDEFRKHVISQSTVAFFTEPQKLASDVRQAIHNVKLKSKLITDPNYFEPDQPESLEGSNLPYDHRVCRSASLSDLDLEQLTAFFNKEMVQLQQDFIPNATLKERLNKLGLFHEAFPTYGALLCFGNTPQKWSPGATTRCIHWRGDDRESGWIKNQECRGNLIRQYEDVLSFLKTQLHFSRVIGREERSEQYEVPLTALQELIANALVHREYQARLESIQIEIYGSRIEIKSPGNLPPPMSLPLLGKEDLSHPRNPQIARLFYLYGHVEKVGSGIPRVQRFIGDTGLPPVEFRLSEAGTFAVVVQRPTHVPSVIVESAEFGELLARGVERMAATKKEPITSVEAELSSIMGSESGSIVRQWLRGFIPPQPEQVATLARVLVQQGGMQESWLISFLNAAQYSKQEDLIAELFPAELRAFNNLPVQSTPFIGRETEVNRLQKFLRDEDVRLMVLTGMGGIGKSRLAQRVAADLAGEFEHGVCFVPLTIINDPDLVPSAIARTLQIREQAGTSVIDVLRRYLESKELLLLLDDFEHVEAAAKVIAELLASCPRLKVLITSRKLTRIRGARNFVVPPLALPDEGGYDASALSQYDAVRLFIQSASVVSPEFTVTNENAQSIAEICVRLEGLPLAIELVASRLNALSPQDILVELDRVGEGHLNLMSKGSFDLPARQRTMRATIAWSYDRLSEGEKMLFRRLSVFSGGCTLEAAGRVCDAEGDLKINIQEGLNSLVESNLLQQVVDGRSNRRFLMLDILKEYGRELLEEMGEGGIRRRHAEFFLALAEQADTKIPSTQRHTWTEIVDIENDNLRAVLEWCHKSEGNIEIELRLGGALYWFWLMRGSLNEGLSWLNGALKKGDMSLRTAANARALFGAGGLAFLHGDYTAARSRIDESVAIWRELGDSWRLAHTLILRGVIASVTDESDSALGCVREGTEIFQRLNDTWGLALSLNDLGNVHHSRGEYSEAAETYEKSLRLWQGIGDEWGISMTLSNLGKLYTVLGDYSTAQDSLEESLSIQKKLGNNFDAATTLTHLATLAARRQKYPEAAKLYGESLMLNREIGARRLLIESIEGMAVVAGKVGRVEDAAQLLGATDSLRANSGFITPFASKHQKEIVDEVGSKFKDLKAFNRIYKKGQRMSLDNAITCALAASAALLSESNLNHPAQNN